MGVAGHERHEAVLASDGHGDVLMVKRRRAEVVATEEDALNTE